MQEVKTASKMMPFQDEESSLINKLYLKALIPSVIAVLGGTINVFFDGIMVGQKLGDVGLESINLALPIYLFLCSIGSLIASGAVQLSAIAFGKGDKEEGNRILGVAMTLAVACSVIFCGLALILVKPLTVFLGTTETYDYLLSYLRITLMGGIFKVLMYIPYLFLRLEGKNAKAMNGMLIMIAINIGLDAFFLFALDTGIEGAAWASVIATVIADAIMFLFMFTGRTNFRLRFFIPKGKDFHGITRFGLMMALNSLFSALKILLVTKILAGVDAVGYTAIFAIVNNLSEFSVCIQNGVPQASGAMFGILFGERNSTTIKSLLKTEIVSGIVLSGLFASVLFLFADKMAGLFGSSVDATMAVWMLAASLIFATVNSLLAYYYNAINHQGLANIITVLRCCGFIVMFCLMFCGMGDKVWAFYPVTEITTLLLTLLLNVIIAKQSQEQFFYLVNKNKADNVLAFTVPCDNDKICEASEKVSSFCDDNNMAPKTAMTVSLSIEELLTITADKSLSGNGNMNVRILCAEDSTILRIRSGGKPYNAIREQTDDIEYMGVRMIAKLAKRVEYQSTLGVNTLMIYI